MSRLAAGVRVLVSFALAADIGAVACALAVGDVRIAPLFLAGLGVVMLLVAMPAYVLLQLRRRETWRTCLAAGFVIGGAVGAVASAGVPLSARLQAVGIVGGIGAGAGLAFWAALRTLEHAARTPRLGRVGPIAAVLLAIGASWAILWLPVMLGPQPLP